MDFCQGNTSDENEWIFVKGRMRMKILWVSVAGCLEHEKFAGYYLKASIKRLVKDDNALSFCYMACRQ